MKRFAVVLATLLAASSARAQEEPAPRPTRPTNRTLVSFDGGYAYQNLYATDINGFGLSTVLGADFSTWAFAALAELDHGWTVYGIETTTFSLGPLFEGHFGRFRLGGGPRVGVMLVDRVTAGSVLGAPSAGLFARASLDVIPFDEGHGAFFVVGRAGVDTVGTSLFGASLGLGVRF